MAQKIDRRRFLALSGTAGVTGLTGAAAAIQDDNETDEEIEEEPEPEEGGEILSWHAGGTGGTYYPLSGEFKTIVEDNTPHGLQVQSTGASVENVGSLAREEAEFALIQNDVAFFAYNGTGLEEFEGNAIENLRGVATLYPETIHILVDAGSGIESVEDLEGRTINTGDLGSGTQVNALQILETVGITQDDFEEQNTGFSAAADQLRDGDIDAAFIVGGWPVGAVEELATTADIDIVEISGDTRENILEGAEWFAEDTIPGGTYDGVDEDVDTVSVQAMIATHEGVADDVVTDVTAAIFDNADDLSIKSEFIELETALEGMSIELHPGAEAYFEESELDLEEELGDGEEEADEAEDGDADADVAVSSHPDLGDVLVGSDGMTLYMFDQDEQGADASACYDGCAENWPPLTVDGEPTAGEDVTAELTTFERDDGSMQVAANGWPLYFFEPDEEPGDANGQGANDVWWVLGPDGTPMRDGEDGAMDGGNGNDTMDDGNGNDTMDGGNGDNETGEDDE